MSLYLSRGNLVFITSPTRGEGFLKKNAARRYYIKVAPGGDRPQLWHKKSPFSAIGIPISRFCGIKTEVHFLNPGSGSRKHGFKPPWKHGFRGVYSKRAVVFGVFLDLISGRKVFPFNPISFNRVSMAPKKT